MNSAIIDYGSEPTGFNATQDLYVVNNTIVNDRPAGGTFVQVAAMVTTPAVLTNNIFVGGGTVTTQASAVQTANYTGTMPMFAAPATFDYHLLAGSPCVDAGMDPGMTAGGVSLAADDAVRAPGDGRRAHVGRRDRHRRLRARRRACRSSTAVPIWRSRSASIPATASASARTAAAVGSAGTPRRRRSPRWRSSSSRWR